LRNGSITVNKFCRCQPLPQKNLLAACVTQRAKSKKVSAVLSQTNSIVKILKRVRIASSLIVWRSMSRWSSSTKCKKSFQSHQHFKRSQNAPSAARKKWMISTHTSTEAAAAVTAAMKKRKFTTR